MDNHLLEIAMEEAICQHVVLVEIEYPHTVLAFLKKKEIKRHLE